MPRNEFCIPVRQVICIDNFFACKLNANNMQWIHFEVLLQKLHCAVPVTLHVLYFHCMFIGIQNSCKLKVRAVQWRFSSFFSGKWRCDAVEAICPPWRSGFFFKTAGHMQRSVWHGFERKLYLIIPIIQKNKTYSLLIKYCILLKIFLSFKRGHIL